MAREVRHEQLTALAMPIVAEQGLAEFSLEEVTLRADVTRKLLYHYFPRGRQDVVLAVANRAGEQLTEHWITDEQLPLPDRLLANIAPLIEHAMQQTDAWKIYRLARASTDPEVRRVVQRFVDVVTASISLNNLGTSEPPPLPRLAIRGFIGFFETVLDDARGTEVPLDQVTRMLVNTLAAAIEVAADAAP